jgi:hypothetical protein
MRGIFKSGWMENKDPMKQLGILVPILLILGVGIACGLASASQLTADQDIQPPSVAVGEKAIVTVTLSYDGNDALNVSVTPEFADCIDPDSGRQERILQPREPQMISYGITAKRSGLFDIASLITYSEGGWERQLRKVSLFTVTAPVQIGSNPEGGSSPEGNDSMPSDQSPLPLPIIPAPSANESAHQTE